MNEVVRRFAFFLIILYFLKYLSLGYLPRHLLKNQFRKIPMYGRKPVTIKLDIIISP